MTLQLTENAVTVLKSRYLLGDETPEALFRRVADAVAAPEKDPKYWADTFYEMMASCRFMPNSPTLFNAGTGQGTLSACFVIPVEDTMESIMEAATTSAMIQKFGGGIGYAFSKLRSRGAHISTTHGKACGAVAVLKMLSAISNMITQGGKRHGANMGILHVRHPEVLDFIHMKDDNETAQNFNISVAITDEFMEAVRERRDWDLIDPHTQEVTQTLPAWKIWDEIVQSAWQTGDPGLYFIDEANRHNPTPHLGYLDSTNPCGEVPLLAHEACNLGSINLARFVEGSPATGEAQFNFAALEDIAAKAARFLDNVVTVNEFPEEKVARAVHATRKIGLGVMGWHDALMRLGIPYDAPEALELADQVMSRINQVARSTSLELAKERSPYPECREADPIRNATRTCIAPTGSISAIAGCSSGIEPIFALAFVKNVLDGRRLSEVNPYFEQVARAGGFYSEELMEEVVRTGSVQGLEGVPEEIQRLFRTAMEVDYETHVRMQAIFQQHTDLAVSKTINMRHEATVADVHRAYSLAYDSQCSGITIYRDRSKPTQVLEVAASSAQEGAAGAAAPRTARERPSAVKGVTERIRTGHGNMFVTMNFDEAGDPFEVFTALGKGGGCDSAQLEAISRLISLALRSGIAAEEIVSQLRGITCCPQWDQGVLVRSAPDAVALAMSRHTLPGGTSLEHAYGAQIGMFSGEELEQRAKPANGLPRGAGDGAPSTSSGDNRMTEFSQAGPHCPDCSSTLVYQEGCLQCPACGYTKCG